MRRVVITGMGAITPLGNSVRAMMDAQLAGRSGVGLIQHFNAASFPTKFAAEVKDFDLAHFVGPTQRWAHSGVNSQFAAAAAHQALTSAGLLDESSVDRSRFGTYLGSGEGVQDFDNMVSAIARAYRAEK